MQTLRLIGIALVMATSGCGGEADGASEGEREVVAAIYPLAWAADEIARAETSVVNLTPPGVEPHDFELTPRDVARIRGADIVLYLGNGLQPALEDALDGENNGVDLLEGISLRRPADDEAHGGEAEEHDEEFDPHVWLDPVLYAGIVRRIGDELGEPDRAELLAGRVEALHDEFEEGLRDCRHSSLVTSHAAFGYLAARYDLEQIAISGVSPEAEPTPRELERVVEHVREAGATTIFFETLVSPRIARVVARETGAQTAVLNPLEGLTEEEDERGEDYLSVMRDNLRTLRGALACR